MARRTSTSRPLKASELFDVDDIDTRDPQWYGKALNGLLRKFGQGILTPLGFGQSRKALEDMCQSILHMSIEEAGRQQASAFERCTDAILTSEPDIVSLEKLYGRADQLTDEVKKKCLNLLSRVRKLQEQARKDPLKAWLYIGRDSEGKIPEERQDRYGAGFFDLQWFHVAFFMVFEHRIKRKRLIEAPPGHGKTTVLRWWAATKIGREPWRRICWLADVKDKAWKEVRLLDAILSHPRYRVIYPELRIQSRPESERSSRRFTVSRLNEFSREPTVEGWGMTGGVNGNGYDLLICDDICDETVRSQPTQRKLMLDRFDSVIKLRLRGWENTEICYICTPWHDDDVAGMTEQRINAGAERGWLVFKDPLKILDDDEGRAIPIWPSKYPSHVLEDMKVSSSYNQTHRLETRRDAERKVTVLSYYNSEDKATPEEKDMQKVIDSCERWLSIDPSATIATWSSDTGVVEIRITNEGLTFCSDVWFKHLGPVQMQNWIIRQLYHAPPPGYHGVLIEAQGAMTGQVSGWVYAINKALEQGRIPEDISGDIVRDLPPLERIPNLKPVTTRVGGAAQNRSKLQRFHDASGYIQRGWVRFAGKSFALTNYKTGADYIKRKAVPGSDMETFEHVLLHFDGTNRSDAVDALTQWILDNKHRIKNPHLREAEKAKSVKMDPMTEKFQKQLAGVKDQFNRLPQNERQLEKQFFESLRRAV